MKVNSDMRVSSADMQKIIESYFSGTNPTQKISDYENIGEQLLLLATKLSKSASFNRYPRYFIEDVIGNSVIQMLDKLNKYDYLNFKNPFAYFTTIAFNIFRRDINQYYSRKNKECSQLNLDSYTNVLVGTNPYSSMIDNSKVSAKYDYSGIDYKEINDINDDIQEQIKKINDETKEELKKEEYILDMVYGKELHKRNENDE